MLPHVHSALQIPEGSHRRWRDGLLAFEHVDDMRDSIDRLVTLALFDEQLHEHKLVHGYGHAPSHVQSPGSQGKGRACRGLGVGQRSFSTPDASLNHQ